MLKDAQKLRVPDPYFGGTAGSIGRTLESLHQDMLGLEIPITIPESVRRIHDAIRHAYIYSYYSYDLLTLAASQTFPCLELALRERIGSQFQERANKKGKPRPAMLNELLKIAKAQGLISLSIEHLSVLRNMYAHGGNTILNPPLFLCQFKYVTKIIQELFTCGRVGAADYRQ